MNGRASQKSTAPLLFAHLTAELEDTVSIAIDGQSARNTVRGQLRLAHRVRAGVNRSTALVDKIFETLAVSEVGGGRK